MCNKIIVKLWAKHFDEHLTFVCHENTQCNQNYCHEKTIWCERDAFVLNLDFPNIKTFALRIALPSIIRNTAFGLTTVILRTLKKSSSFVVWNKIKHFTILTNVGICITMYIFNSIKEDCLFYRPPLKILRATDILKSVRSFFAKINLTWRKKGLVTCSTDGAPVRLGTSHGCTSLGRKGAPHMTVTHCFLCWR